jgi:hypothetical protein
MCVLNFAKQPKPEIMTCLVYLSGLQHAIKPVADKANTQIKFTGLINPIMCVDPTHF